MCFKDKAILPPTNDLVEVVNHYMLNLMPSNEKAYLSFDTLISLTSEIDCPDNVHTPKFLNTLVTLGIPNHVLTLKVIIPVMLLQCTLKVLSNTYLIHQNYTSPCTAWLLKLVNNNDATLYKRPH